MSEIVWEDPPPPRRGGGGERVWEKRLAPLKANPGKWANLGRHQSTTVTSVKQGLFAGVEAGEFECLGREFDNKTNEVTVFARYVGKADLKAVGE